jgi:hypothetical protein
MYEWGVMIGIAIFLGVPLAMTGLLLRAKWAARGARKANMKLLVADSVANESKYPCAVGMSGAGMSFNRQMGWLKGREPLGTDKMKRRVV